jgi:hypothetical protein
MTQAAQKPRRRVTRPAGIRVVNLSLPRDAVDLLHHFAPTTKSHGQFVARLLYEHRYREEERRRLVQDVTP